MSAKDGTHMLLLLIAKCECRNPENNVLVTTVSELCYRLTHTSAQLQMKKKDLCPKFVRKKRRKKDSFLKKKGEKRIGKSVFFWSFFQTDR